MENGGGRANLQPFELMVSQGMFGFIQRDQWVNEQFIMYS